MSMVPVTDIAVHQGTVDFVTMAGAGVEHVIIRAGNGDVDDELAAQHTRGARAAGLSVSYYWFINPKVESHGTRQADRFLGRINELGHSDLPPMLDVESFAKEPSHGFPPIEGEAYLQWLEDAVMEMMLLDARLPLIYSNHSFWDGPAGPRAPGTLGNCPLVVARFPFYSKLACLLHPIPKDARRWEGWIYSATQQRPQPPLAMGPVVGWQFSAGFNRAGAAFGASSIDLDCNLFERDWYEAQLHPVAVSPPIEQPPIEPPPIVVTSPVPMPTILEEDDMQFIAKSPNNGSCLVTVFVHPDNSPGYRMSGFTKPDVENICELDSGMHVAEWPDATYLARAKDQG